MNKKNSFKSIIPLKKDELGKLKGGFSVYEALPTLSVQNSVTVTVTGECGCGCEAQSNRHLLL